MAELIWSLEEGLHEMNAGEARNEASRLANRAQRAKKRSRREELMHHAARLFHQADQLSNNEEREEVIARIAHEKNLYRRDRIIEQARRRWPDIKE
jgi:hypothetical protein